MKKLRFFDSLKFVVAAIVCTFILNVAHAATTTINSVIAYGKTEQSATPTPTNPVPIMTNNGELRVSRNLFDATKLYGMYLLTDTGEVGNASENYGLYRYFDVKPNTTYTFSYVSGLDSQYRRVCGYDNTGTFTELLLKVTRSQGGVAGDSIMLYFTTGATTTRIAISTIVGDTNIILREKSVYTNGLTETIRDAAGHTATAQMLLGLNDTYRDEQNINTGAITRKVGVKVLDGTESWTRSSSRAGLFYSKSAFPNITVGDVLCTHMPYRANLTKGYIYSNNGELNFWTYFDDFTTAEQFKSWLAEQYAAGTPVIVVYPLATETTESVAPQSLTTAPVRQTAGSILGMPIEVVFGDGTREWVSEIITIATTKYNEQQFAPVQNELSNAMNAVDTVVTQTMAQAQAIDQIATTKQTRPNESCPPFKKCLLVEGEDGTPHWYEIYDPINDFLNPILAAAGLSGNQGAPVQTIHACGSNSTCYDEYNGFYMGNGDFRQKYIDNIDSTYERPFGPTTLARCSVPVGEHTNTDTREAGLCYNTGGMFRTLTEGSDDDSGEWAVVYNGNEGGASLGITPGVVYGIAKCTTVGQHATEMTGDVADGSDYWWPKKLTGYTGGGTTLASLITEYPNSNVETVFNTLPSEYGTDEKPGYPRANFRNCWCKMTAIGVPGAGDTPDQRYTNGTIMSVSGGWVFANATSLASGCASGCARNCTIYVQARAAFRRAVLTVK